MDTPTKTTGRLMPWNKGKLLGQKPPLKLKEIWAIPSMVSDPTPVYSTIRREWYAIRYAS